MKGNFQKMRCKVAKLAAKASATATALSLSANTMVVNAGNWAAGEQSPQSIIGAIVDTVINVFPLVGIFFIASGVFKLVMAYRNDQPEAMGAAAKDAVIGVVLLVFRIFMWNPIKAAVGM